MDEVLRAHVDDWLGQIEELSRRGRQARASLSVDVVREWQRECAGLINQLSGGSKAHWLSRAYSSAFLVRATDGAVVVEATAAEIVDRILDVLAQARASLAGIDSLPAATQEAPPPRRFEFVRNAELRPVLEQTFVESRDALERGEFGLALLLSCGIIETLLTDALGGVRVSGPDAPEAPVAGLPFEARIAAAERAGLIRGGCARLPPVALRYRDLTDAAGALRADVQVSEREARIAGQVLRVVMRDLDPGR